MEVDLLGSVLLWCVQERGSIIVGWIESTRGHREGQDAHVWRVFDQTIAQLEGQQLSPQTGIFLQQTQNPPLQDHVIGSSPLSGPLCCLVVFSPLVPVAFVLLLNGHKLTFAGWDVAAAFFISASPRLRLRVGGFVSALKNKTVAQKSSGQLAGGGQDGSGFIREGSSSNYRPGLQVSRCLHTSYWRQWQVLDDGADTLSRHVHLHQEENLSRKTVDRRLWMEHTWHHLVVKK